MPHRFDAALKELFTPAPEDFVPVFHLPTVRPTVPLNIDLSTISAAIAMDSLPAAHAFVGHGKPTKKSYSVASSFAPAASRSDAERMCCTRGPSGPRCP